jgi:hypothetical protein
MAVVALHSPPRDPSVDACVDAVVDSDTKTALTLRSLRLRLTQLSALAAQGAGPLTLAAALARLWEDAACPANAVPEVLAEIATGCCAMARWLDAERSVQAVPPLCVVVWRVSGLQRHGGPAKVWLDLVLPDDGRRAQAQAWASDIRLLLAQAQIPCQSEWILIPRPAGTFRELPLPPQGGSRVWGCQSLFHHYQLSGELQEALSQRGSALRAHA